MALTVFPQLMVVIIFARFSGADHSVPPVTSFYALTIKNHTIGLVMYHLNSTEADQTCKKFKGSLVQFNTIKGFTETIFNCSLPDVTGMGMLLKVDAVNHTLVWNYEILLDTSVQRDPSCQCYAYYFPKTSCKPGIDNVGDNCCDSVQQILGSPGLINNDECYVKYVYLCKLSLISNVHDKIFLEGNGCAHANSDKMCSHSECECIKKNTSFNCHCNQHETMNPAVDGDVDECLERPSWCDHNCTNTNGSYYCTCRTGYHLNTTDNKTCHDINECDNTTLCQHRCHNTPGSYFCACPDGFQTGPDGHSCVRRNSSHVCPCKCSSKPSPTHQQAEKDVYTIRRELSIDARDLSNFKRKNTCAEDSRVSAQVTGYLGVAFLVVISGVIALPDVLKIFRFLGLKLNKTNILKN